MPLSASLFILLLLGYLFCAESGKLYALFCFAFYVLGCLCVAASL
jgi:hypothetical protein